MKTVNSLKQDNPLINEAIFQRAKQMSFTYIWQLGFQDDLT
jgi:hypothetical protein